MDNPHTCGMSNFHSLSESSPKAPSASLSSESVDVLTGILGDAPMFCPRGDRIEPETYNHSAQFISDEYLVEWYLNISNKHGNKANLSDIYEGIFDIIFTTDRFLA